MKHAFVAALLVIGCGSAKSEPHEPIAPSDGRPVGAAPMQTAPPAAADPAPAANPPPTGGSNDAPEISRSRGVRGGMVVLWPRIVLPRDVGPDPDAQTRQIAARVQKHQAELAKRLPNRPVDVRPEPERVCPRDGCQTATLGALFTRAGDGCAVIALVSPPGPSPARLVPWAGAVRLTSTTVPFREPPERVLSVPDYVPCDKLEETMRHADAQVEAALRAAAR